MKLRGWVRLIEIDNIFLCFIFGRRFRPCHFKRKLQLNIRPIHSTKMKYLSVVACVVKYEKLFDNHI